MLSIEQSLRPMKDGFDYMALRRTTDSKQSQLQENYVRWREWR